MLNALSQAHIQILKSQFTTLESAHVDALYQDNVKNDQNVKQLKDVFEYYGLTI